MDRVIMPTMDTRISEAQIKPRRSRVGRAAAVAGLMTVTASFLAVTSGVVGGERADNSVTVTASLPPCGEQKGVPSELIIIAGRNAPLTVSPDNSSERFVSLEIGEPGQITILENPGAVQPPLRLGQDIDVKNFEFKDGTQLSIDPGIDAGPGSKTKLTILKVCE